MMETRKDRYYSLEAGRGIAAFIVVLRHVCVFSFEGPHYFFLIPSPSAIAVIYFFVLSGAVMGLAHAQSKPSFKTGIEFLLRRACRIYPLYWIMTAAMLFVWPMLYQPEQLWRWLSLVPETDAAGAPVIRDLIAPAWTLHWEIFFYLVFALSLMLPKRGFLLVAWMALILVFYPAHGFSTLAGLNQAIFVIVSPLGLFFLAGIGVAEAVRRYAFSPASGYGLLAIACCVIVYYFHRYDLGLYLPRTRVDFIVGAIGMGALAAGLMILERHGKLPINRWWLALGKLSYPLYISHWFSIQFVGRFFWLHHIDMVAHVFWFAAASLVVSIIAGVAITYLLDLPMQRGLRWLFAARFSMVVLPAERKTGTEF